MKVIKKLDKGWCIIRLEDGELGLMEPKDAQIGPNGELMVPEDVMNMAIEFCKSHD